MNQLKEIDSYSEIFRENKSLLDIRAPIEFIKGSFPSSLNLPLMTDEERHQIGLCYKEKGQENAIKLGHELVKDGLKDHRVSNWLDFINNNPNGALFCFRGGLRSKIAQEWIYENSGICYPRVKGGYKALRSFLLNETSRISTSKEFIVIGGQTGCGKTLLLNTLNNSIDLEGLANHRGSAFGNNVSPQPKQINFENNLAINLIEKESNPILLIEDEGSNIGVIQLPEAIKSKSLQSNIIILTASLEERIKISIQAYVIDMAKNYCLINSQDGFEKYSEYWINSLYKIQKRLGGDRYKLLKKQLNIALTNHKKNEDLAGYYPLIEALLVDYYDPMYNYQISKKKQRIIFQGSHQSVIDYLVN